MDEIIGNKAINPKKTDALKATSLDIPIIEKKTIEKNSLIPNPENDNGNRDITIKRRKIILEDINDTGIFK